MSIDFSKDDRVVHFRKADLLRTSNMATREFLPRLREPLIIYQRVGAQTQRQQRWVTLSIETNELTAWVPAVKLSCFFFWSLWCAEEMSLISAARFDRLSSRCFFFFTFLQSGCPSIKLQSLTCNEPRLLFSISPTPHFNFTLETRERINRVHVKRF